MISVAILGNGNVATHLFSAFSKVENVSVVQVNSRKLETIIDTDITIIAVSDDAITEVSKVIKRDPLVEAVNYMKERKSIGEVSVLWK